MSIIQGRVQITDASGTVLSQYPVQITAPITAVLSGSVGGVLPVSVVSTVANSSNSTVSISGSIGSPATIRVEGTTTNGGTGTPNPVQISGRNVSGNNIVLEVSTQGKLFTIPVVSTGGTTYDLAGNTAGEVFTRAGGHSTTISVTGTISTTAYAEKDSIGGKWTFADAVRSSGGSATLQTVVLSDRSRASGAIDLIFYAQDPSVTSISDNSPLNLANQDLLKIVGVVNIGNTDYLHLVNNAVCVKAGLGLAFKCPTGTTLYCTPIARNAPQYASAQDLCLMITLYQD